MMRPGSAPLGWLGIVRLGLVQTALGAIVVLTTSTMNRVMVVELALPAMLPGILVAIHYAVQILRPRLGHGSDVGGRRTPWILGGMGVLALGGLGAATATALMATHLLAGVALAALAFVLVGIGVGAAGTSLLVLLAKRVDARRRPAAATIVWVMMIMGFIVTAGTAGHFLDPFTTTRLVAVTASVCGIALVLTAVALAGVEGREPAAASVAEASATAAEGRAAFRDALREVWNEPQSRRFAIFVFVSMLAYSAQDLILEPFAGSVFGFSPGASTQLAGVQHGGVLAGMIFVAVMGTALRIGSMRVWTTTGCIASAIALLGLAAAAFSGGAWPLRANVFALGFANGVFAVAAIGSMMTFVDQGRARREGVRMGLWGAAQAIAFGLGGFLGTAAYDGARRLLDAPAPAYAAVFAAEAILFVVSVALALGLASPDASANGASTNGASTTGKRRADRFGEDVRLAQ